MLCLIIFILNEGEEKAKKVKVNSQQTKNLKEEMTMN